MTDRRDIPANDRVAHVSQRGRVAAERYVEGTDMRVRTPVAGIRNAPDSAALERQLPSGEAFCVLEVVGGWAFGRAGSSGYCGYVRASDLGPWFEPTHRVCARSTFAFAVADLKHPDPDPLSLGSLVRVCGQTGPFSETSQGRFVPSAHLRRLDSPEDDPVAVAERLIGAPYLWGGNTAFGIDCSGLVQIGLLACSIPCPGDSDQQEKALGRFLPPGTPPRRGDLMFWKGHAAWVADAATLLHANGHHMAVCAEPLGAAVSRIADQGGGPITAHKRLAEDARKGG